MNTAQNIIDFHNVQIGTFEAQRAAENDARLLAIKTDAPNCLDRTWTFFDGSKIVKTRDGLKAE